MEQETKIYYERLGRRVDSTLFSRKSCEVMARLLWVAPVKKKMVVICCIAVFLACCIVRQSTINLFYGISLIGAAAFSVLLKLELYPVLLSALHPVIFSLNALLDWAIYFNRLVLRGIDKSLLKVSRVINTVKE